MLIWMGKKIFTILHSNFCLSKHVKQINIFVLPENLLSILESGQSKDKGLYIQCLHFLSVVCSEEGKLKTKRPADNSSVTMTTLLDLPLQSGILIFYF